MKLSIIVPVYNMAADNKLTWCLDSLINQTLDDYEIIAVDDCSTDNSLEILKDYERRFPSKFKAVHSDINRHQGGAKNIGLKLALGEWIGFIDSDDWIVPNYYERLINRAEETDSDIVGCDYCLVHEHTYKVSNEIVANSRKDQVGPLTHESKASLIMDGGSLCVKIFKRKNIVDNELWFPEDIFYEDNALSDAYLLTANRFEYIPEPLYYYYQHGDSTVHTFSETRCNDRLIAGRIMLKEAHRLGIMEEFHDEIEYKFTLLFYINTLFTYMPCVKPTRLSYVKDITREMLTTFPGFRSNHYYVERTGQEEKKLINMACQSPLRFYIYYKLLWFYRNLRKKLAGNAL